MKAYLLIMAILFIYIKSDCSATSGIDRYTDCTNRVLSLVEKGFGNSYCCYIYGVNGNEKKKRCTPISQNEYDNMEKTIDYYTSIYAFNIKSFDCKSSYIQIGLLGLLFLLF